MHNWGDEKVDWQGINDAAEFLGTNLVRFGLINVRDWKEKYGTVRVYLSFGWESLHSITHPRHVYIRYERDGWLWKLNYSPFVRGCVHYLNKAVIPYQVWLYKFLYKRAIKKWPHLMTEILSAADYHELLDNLTPEWQATRIAMKISWENREKLEEQIYALEERVEFLESTAPYKKIEWEDDDASRY